MSAVDALGLDRADEIWARIVEAAPQAWCWHTRRWAAFVRSACPDPASLDLSFFVFQDDTPLAVVPLIVSNVTEGGHVVRDASYNGGPLPWPAVVPPAPDIAGTEAFAFVEAERRARAAGAERIRFASSSPFVTAPPADWFEPVAVKLGYLDASYDSHLVAIDGGVFDRVRKRYRQYVRKHRDGFECCVRSGAEVDDQLERDYFELHVKDAGGQFRPRESYTRFADLARHGEGFFVTARHRSSGRVAGLLLVSLVKGAAYDSSVAIDPDFEASFVSYLLKWRTLEHLVTAGVSHYELGRRWVAASLDSVPDAKMRGIAFFKDGWSRGATKRVRVADKPLTKDGLDKHLRARQAAIEKLLGL